MTTAPTALVLRAAGTNCDLEVCRAFELAGATPELVHIDTLIAEPERLERAELVAFPGGFSFGDDVASGRIFAMKLRERVYPQLKAAAERGVPMIGICNGFQIMVQIGLLPGPAAGAGWPDTPPVQSVSLTDNKTACYIDDWIPLELNPASSCVWTESLDPEAGDDILQLPIGHAEGRLVGEPDTLAALEAGGQVVLRYKNNLNGSERAIAGICDPTGRLFGLMPHPDRFLSWKNHPFWTRLDPGVRTGDTPGLAMFRSAVRAVVGQAV